MDEYICECGQCDQCNYGPSQITIGTCDFCNKENVKITIIGPNGGVMGQCEKCE